MKLGTVFINKLDGRTWTVVSYGDIDGDAMVRLSAPTDHGGETLYWVMAEDMDIADIWEKQ